MGRQKIRKYSAQAQITSQLNELLTLGKLQYTTEPCKITEIVRDLIWDHEGYLFRYTYNYSACASGISWEHPTDTSMQILFNHVSKREIVPGIYRLSDVLSLQLEMLDILQTRFLRILTSGLEVVNRETKKIHSIMNTFISPKEILIHCAAANHRCIQSPVGPFSLTTILQCSACIP